MNKKRNWQFALILAVVGLTIYNILPTLFFYLNPLGSPVSKSLAEQCAKDMAARVDELEGSTVEWIESYCQLFDIHPQSVQVSGTSPDLIEIKCAKSEEAATLRKFLPRAGLLIPFAPSQLQVLSTPDTPKEVLVQRQIGVRLSPLVNQGALFEYIPKMDGEGVSLRYRSLIQKRLEAVASCLATPSLPASSAPSLVALATAIGDLAALYEAHPEFTGRYGARLAKIADKETMLRDFAAARDELKKAKQNLSAENLVEVEKTELTLAAAESFLKKKPGLFIPNAAPSCSLEDRIDFAKSSPFFSSLSLDWNNNQAILHLHPDLEESILSGETGKIVRQLLIDEVARLSNSTQENISPAEGGYAIALQKMQEMTGVLACNLDVLAERAADTHLFALKAQWRPEHADLLDLPIVKESEYESLSPVQKSLCLVARVQGGSLQLKAKGLSQLLRTYEDASDTPEARLFLKDFQRLAEILASRGFGLSAKDQIVFEKAHLCDTLLAATRESFQSFGSLPTAILELSNVEERIIAQNKIETKMHEDLLKWSEEYRSCQVSLHGATRYDVPEPNRNVFWSNLKLSAKKMFRGDETKILRWGLDLSGGKSVQIELRDQNNHVVTEEADLKQGINELFTRVNKMGVSDVSIRRVGNNIELDFPGSQALSAAELVKASSMFFHVVNEKFGPQNPSVAPLVDRFLQEVWNEATVLQTQDLEHVQAIAFRHLHGPSPSHAAKLLLEEGLHLADPVQTSASKALNDALSMVAIARETNQPHPLLIVFRNHVLEGSDLIDVRSNYDPSKGNYLSFDVQGSDARARFFDWTSAFSKEKVLGTVKEEYSRGNGWRMAVLLNGSVISAPTLESPLQGSAQISGHFTQREINQLTADLKAGSLSFTPRILSEKNISPELGKTDRMKGIFATVAALILVIVSMVAYYRFAGIVASVAVLFNLLILWAVLQNLGASLSLAGIAGIILTVGMAVDANVLVFERMKEEFAISGRISAAIQAGYEKAFSAILDSNVTTIIAALILLNFDAGPIKAFAVAMIIGIASSMFTALFMTRVYFNYWVRKPRNTTLRMANWIRASNFDFLRKAKYAFAIALAVIGIGGASLCIKNPSPLGMDFTGGYSLQVELAKADPNLSEKLKTSLVQQGAATRDFQIRQQSSATHCQILLSTSMEQEGKPFHHLPLVTDSGSNPRIDWILNAFEGAELSLAPASKSALASHWTAMSGQMSDSMRNNAILGIVLAFCAIFIYIAIRFEYKYAVAALLCLLHDVLVTLGAMGLLHALNVPIQIDLNTIAAIMTIIGYSLNDTIIVFDRIREDTHLHPKRPIAETVNLALNATLSRTTITSGTTLLVLVALLIFGGGSIFSFALVMTLGVIFGTLSSWFIASPLMLFFHRKEESTNPI